MKKLLACTAGVLFYGMATAQEMTLPLYPNGKIPNAQPSGEQEKKEAGETIKISLVQTPDIAVFLPSKRLATGQAVVICPGGGYAYLSYSWEGTDPARWLAAKGIAAIVLKYRLPNSKSNITPHLSPLLDAKRALRLVRANAAAWNIKKDRIGIMGFSAGGHLAATLATHFDAGNPADADPVERESSRPDFAVLVYPVITMSKPVMHPGSRNNLLGEKPPAALANLYSNELQVSKETPPAFLVHALDDKSVPVENSLLFVEAMKAAGVTGELHVFPKGGHGFGLGVGRGRAESWTALCIDWLRGLQPEP